jgi:signal transduction histidine kinase
MQNVAPQKRASGNTPTMMGVVIVLVVALVAAGILMELFGQSAYREAEQASTLLVKQRNAYSLLIDMETGVRGYVIAGDERFLEPYNNATKALPGAWDEMSALAVELDRATTPTTPTLAVLVERVENLAQAWQTQFAEPEIALQREGRAQEAMSRIASGTGKAQFDALRGAVAQLDTATNEHLRSFSRDLNRTRQIELSVLIGLGVLAVASALLTFRVARSESGLQTEATRAAERETQRLQAILESLPVAVRLVAPPNGDILLQNRAAYQLFPKEIWNKLTPEERVNYFSLTSPDGTPLLPEELPGLRSVRQGISVVDFELRTARPGADPKHLLTSAVPVKDEQGKVTLAAVVMQDVTQMKQVDQRKDEFIATAAHELRSPLAALSGYSQLLQRALTRTEVPPNVSHQIGEMGKLITRLITLVERLLDSSRIQLGRLVLDKSSVNLVELARTVVANAQALDQGAHHIELITPTERIQGEWDATRVEQVISNLVNNALRYSPTNSSVQVSVGPRQNDALVQVVDEGPGVPSEQREHLFDRYYQTGVLSSASLQSGGSRHFGIGRQGLGLGLYISNQIVEAHGGQLGVEPNPEGGSIFWFSLPYK